MPWRVCRIRDFTKHCTSVHSREDVAKVETASQLSGMLDELESNIPRYRGYWAYDKYHPGFVDDLIEMIGAVRRRIEDDDVWGAYDNWHHFMRYWEGKLDPPLWVQVGTIVVEGPGPTAVPAYNPGTRTPPRFHPKAEEVQQTQLEFEQEYLKFFKKIAAEVITRKYKQTGEHLPVTEVLDQVVRAAGEIDFDPTKEQDKDWAWKHYFELIIKNVESKFGVDLGE
jgi:hypothetical protein